jgi:hypothetical protein
MQLPLRPGVNAGRFAPKVPINHSHAHRGLRENDWHQCRVAAQLSLAFLRLGQAFGMNLRRVSDARTKCG